MSLKQQMLEAFDEWEKSPVSQQILAVLNEKLTEAVNGLAASNDTIEMFRCQGQLGALRYVLALPADLKAQAESMEDGDGA